MNRLRLIAASLCALIASAAASVSSRHYEVITDLPPRDAEPIVERVDAMHAALAKRFASFGHNNAKRLHLAVFAETDAYLAHLRGEGIDATNTAGLFYVRSSILKRCTVSFASKEWKDCFGRGLQ